MTTEEPTSTTRADERSPSGDELQSLIWKELSVVARIIARVRWVPVLLISVFVVPLLAFEPRQWMLWLYAGVTAVATVAILYDLSWLRVRPVAPGHIPYLVGTIVVFHTALIVVTGGAESPFLVLYAIIALVPAISIGRPAPAFTIAAFPLTLLWGLTIGAITGVLPDLRPTFLGTAERAPQAWLFLVAQASVFTLACLFASTIVLAMRAVIERTARTAIAMRHELVETMRERNEELVHLSGELAHELKNPLASIQGLSAIVERKLAEGSKEKEQMGVLVAEVRRMGVILDEFLNFSRPATGLSVREVKLADLVAEVVAVHEGLARQRGVELRVAAKQAGVLRCDPRKLKQVLVNLLQNAIDATPSGGEVSIASRAETGARARVITVDDTGSGLAAEVRERLFQPGVTSKKGGSGLGLTIARAIAEQHGGTLTLVDQSEGGCRATLSLPAEPPARLASAKEEP